MTYVNRNETLVKERIGKDLAKHTITVLRMDGMYRHWVCSSGSFNQRFEIITWPGSLCYTGDMGDYLFQRTEDMVAFMERSCMSYHYAAEKCVAKGREKIEEWNEDLFKQHLKDRIRQGKMFTVLRQGNRRTESTKEKIREIISEYENYSQPQDALKAMYESGLWDELPDCNDYTQNFLWCLHAIKWFCKNVSVPQEVAFSE